MFCTSGILSIAHPKRWWETYNHSGENFSDQIKNFLEQQTRFHQLKAYGKNNYLVHSITHNIETVKLTFWQNILHNLKQKFQAVYVMLIFRSAGALFNLLIYYWKRGFTKLCALCL